MFVFAVTSLCSFSLSQRCAHRCLTAVGFLLCSATITIVVVVVIIIIIIIIIAPLIIIIIIIIIIIVINISSFMFRVIYQSVQGFVKKILLFQE